MEFPAVANQARQPMTLIFSSTRRSIAIQRRVNTVLVIKLLEIANFRAKSLPLQNCIRSMYSRLISAVRREYLDHTFFWNAIDLKQKLKRYRQYYNENRTHASLNGQTPLNIECDESARVADLCNFGWATHCRRLFQLPIAS
jgi:Integrase core domain